MLFSKNLAKIMALIKYVWGAATAFIFIIYNYYHHLMEFPLSTGKHPGETK